MSTNNISLSRVPMPEQDPNKRNKNFSEVTLGYTKQMALDEASRCLNCKSKPCVKGCPVNVQIPDFISLIKQGKFEDAYKKIIGTNNLPGICGRVCPQETQCESLCVRSLKGEPVAIGRLERFVADWHKSNSNNNLNSNPQEHVRNPENINVKVAIIGSGPAGLTCAADLAKMGYNVTIFEAFHVAGGVLMYGIPEFRLPKQLVQHEIDIVKSLGVTIHANTVIGKTLTIEDLKHDGFKAIFIGTGAGLPNFTGIPGENLNGVFSANELLTRVNLMNAYKFPEYDTPVKIGRNVAVVGGGNVAMDAARCAKRLGAENVYVIYRRSNEEMPARAEEVHHAKQEGIIFKFLTNPTSIIGTPDGWVKGIECVKMKLEGTDASGRKKPVGIPDSAYVIEIDSVIVAIGTTPNPLIKSTVSELRVQKWGGIIIDEETGATNIPGIFAGGDAVSGAATVIWAMGAGKKASKGINNYLNSLT